MARQVARNGNRQRGAPTRSRNIIVALTFQRAARFTWSTRQAA